MIIKEKSASAPSVVRAQATVKGPYPRKASETTMNVPPQIKPRAMMDIQFDNVDWVGTAVSDLRVFCP